MTEKISVIIPVFNAEKTLEACVRSVTEQGGRETEIILIDDGSTDGTAALVARRAETNPGIRLIRKEKGGVSAARMEAFHDSFDQAFGEQARLDAVNIVSPRQFEVRTPAVVVKVNPDRSDLVETRLIDGHPYILIRADEGVEVNGVSVTV